MNNEIQHYAEYHQQLNPTFMGNQLPWLRTLRKTNLDQFLLAGFPTRREEDWKYTDLSFLKKRSFNWTAHEEEITAAQIAPYLLANTESCQLVFIDGCFSAALSNIDDLPQGLDLTSLAEILFSQPELLRTHLETIAEQTTSSLMHLNAAFANDGVWLRVAKNAQIKQPVHLLFVSTAASQQQMVNAFNVIELAENSQVTVFEQHVSINESPCFKNMVTTIRLQPGAILTHTKLQAEAKQTVHIAQTTVQQTRDSQFRSDSISLGAELARDNLHVALNENNASCTLNGFYTLSNKQHIDHHTRIDHFAPHCNSEENYKGILTDQAKGVFNGKVIVHPSAQKTQSRQINKNLLLSKTAEMNTKPELEIYADDVQCAHGATVGQIDEEALFYLRSRGLDEEQATALLTQAFCNDILDHIQHPAIANYVRRAAARKMEG
jgi:Fe-S cluster assembly protein SufD